MPVKRKRCSFGDCTSNETLNNGLTFYSFPKDPLRRKKWIEVSGCTSPAYHSYICELHFDDIYISRTPRRNTLLSSAVPRAIRDDSSENNSYKITIPRNVSPPPETTEDTLVEEEHYFADYIWNSAGELVKRVKTTEVQDEIDYNNEEEENVAEIIDETMQLDETIEEEILEPIVISTNENSVSEDDVVQEQLVKHSIGQETETPGNNILVK